MKLFFRKENTLVVQDSWKSAGSYTFPGDDYTTEPELTRSNAEWEKMGYLSIDREEAEKMFFDAGFSEAPCL